VIRMRLATASLFGAVPLGFEAGPAVKLSGDALFAAAAR